MFYQNRSVFTVLVTAIIVGQLFSMTPDFTEARKAANKVFAFLKKLPDVDSYSDRGIHPVSCYSSLEI